MEVTLKVNATHGRKAPGRIEIRADEEGLTPHAGLAIVGELARRTGLVELLDGEVAANRRAAPVKQRSTAEPPGSVGEVDADCAGTPLHSWLARSPRGPLVALAKREAASAQRSADGFVTSFLAPGKGSVVRQPIGGGSPPYSKSG